MKVLLLILFVQTFVPVIFCIGSKLTLEISPSLYEHPLFSYAVEVQCTDINEHKWKHLYGSISKNFPSHSFVRKDGKSVEMVIIQFEGIVCRQFDIFVKVLKWTIVATKNTNVTPADEEASTHYRTAMNAKSGGTVYYNELSLPLGSAELQIDLGKHFSLAISPALGDEELYEVVLSCSEHMERIIRFEINAKMCLMGCSKMIFFKKPACPADEYDATIWKWNNEAEKKAVARREEGIHYSKLRIGEGQEYTIQYELKRRI